jgi:hypothetical protein
VVALIKVTRSRVLKTALILAVGAVLLTAIAGSVVTHVIKKKIKTSLEAIDIHIGSLSVNPFTRSITLKDIEWDRKAKIKSAYANGIRLIPLLRDSHISVRRLVLDAGSLDIVRDSVHIQPLDSTDIKGIDADRITISDIAVTIRHDTVTEYQGTVGLTLHFVALDSLAAFADPSAYTFQNLEAGIKDLHIHYAGGLYVFRTKQLKFNKELKKLQIDSVVLDAIPSKARWGAVVKSQETRTELKIAKVDAMGVTLGFHLKDTAVMAKSLTMDGWSIHCYKNKKYPFTRTERFPLPMESFNSIKLAVEVDTIKLRNGTIVYEELPSDGFHDSRVTFDEVDATINAVSNRPYENYPEYSTVQASGRVMKSGEVKAVFKLPLEPKKRYSAEGSISNLPLKELNPLLKDLAFVQIASGKMNKLLFQFRYDDEGSQGQVHFDYEDLRIISLKKDRGQEVDPLKTMLVNVAVKNDKTLDGNINVKRFKRKAVFHLWTISLLDGIKSAVIPGSVDRKKKKK